MPESRHKDCQPGETQRVGTNEGKFTAFSSSSGFQVYDWGFWLINFDFATLLSPLLEIFSVVFFSSKCFQVIYMYVNKACTSETSPFYL